MPRTLDDLLQRSLGARYLLERELGRGGWATVYLARDTKHDRLVAIKVFRPELALSLGTGRFLQEIHLVAQFQHPHILPLHDSGETLNSLYYVMPYVAGESLRDRLTREGPLPVDDAVRIAREVAGALAYAHHHGVVHRDIKPENILLDESGHALVADFGIARALHAARDNRLSHPGVAVGTPAYMAPEQALGGSADPRGDVFSLGVVLYEMLAGEPPFTEASVQGIVARIKRGVDAPALEAKRPDVPAIVADVVRHALAADPEDRFASAREMADALGPGLTPVAGAWTTGSRLVRRRRRRIALGAGALAVLALGAWGIARWRGAGTPSSPDAVVVLPFTVHGAPEYGYLGNGMVDLLTTDLGGAGALRPVDARAVFGALGSAGAAGAPITGDRGAEIARRLGAALFVVGNVTEAGGRLRVDAGLYAHDGNAALVTANAEGDATKLFDLVDEVASELLAGTSRGPAGRLVRLAAVTTRSLPALKAYLEGEALLRAGRADSAVDAFGRAVAADTLFALADYRRAVAADWAAHFDLAREAAASALRHGAHLAPTERRLLLALEAFHRGDARAAEQAYREILRDDPENVEAWYQLGEVLFHLNGVRGRLFTEARAPFERALRYDPQNGDALFHLLDIAGKEQRWRDYDSLLAKAFGESEILLRRRAVRAFASGDRDEQERVLAEMASAGDGTLVVASGQVGAYALDFEGARRIARFLAEPTRGTGTQAMGHLVLARLAMGQGRAAETEMQLRAMAALDPAGALVTRALFALAPSAATPADALQALRDSIAAWNAAADPDLMGPTVVQAHNGVKPIIRAWLLGLLDARLGNEGAARADAAALRAMPALPLAGSLASDLALHVDAALLQRSGRDADALAALARMRGEAPLERLANSPVYAQVLPRLDRAALLERLGRYDEARRWYASIGEGRHDLAWIAEAQLGVARVADHSGDRAAAIAAYQHFVRLRRDGDQPLRAVGDARRRLAALGGREPA